LDDNCEDAASVENAIDEGEIDLEWNELRDISYIDASVRCQKALVHALELLEKGDKKSLHNANKELEVLVGEARRIKKARENDLKKAQEIISSINKLIDICDAHRHPRGYNRHSIVSSMNFAAFCAYPLFGYRASMNINTSATDDLGTTLDIS